MQEENEEQAVDKNFDYLDEEATNTENMGIDSKRKRRVRALINNKSHNRNSTDYSFLLK